MRLVYVYVVCVAVFSVNVQAQQRSDSRANKFDIFIGPQYIASQTISFDHSAKAELNSRASLLFGMGYNFNQHFAIDASFSASSGNYKGTSYNKLGEANTFTSDLHSSAFNMSATYNILPGNFTPFITGILGFTYIDTGVRNGSVSQGCWWDPWYGYQCTTYADTYSETKFNYGGMIGLRYDFPNSVFVKGGAGLNYLDISMADHTGFTFYNLMVGYSFR